MFSVLFEDYLSSQETGGVWAYRPPEFNLLAKQVLQLCSHIPHLKILHQYIVFVKSKNQNGRNDRTRTCNLLAPNQAVYY